MRTYDLLIFHKQADGMTVIKPVHINTYKITGISKAVQQFLLILLTNIGSKSGNSDEGTSLMTTLQTGTIASEENLARIFRIAVLETFQQLSSVEKTEYLDEQIVNVELVDTEVSNAQVTFTANVLTEAGVYPNIVLPLRI